MKTEERREKLELRKTGSPDEIGKAISLGKPGRKPKTENGRQETEDRRRNTSEALRQVQNKEYLEFNGNNWGAAIGIFFTP